MEKKVANKRKIVTDLLRSGVYLELNKPTRNNLNIVHIQFSITEMPLPSHRWAELHIKLLYIVVWKI